MLYNGELTAKNQKRLQLWGKVMKFKAELCMLIVAIALFFVSAFLYSYKTLSEGLALVASFEYPYQGHALSLVGFGSLLMVTASVSFMKRGKTTFRKVASYNV